MLGAELVAKGGGMDQSRLSAEQSRIFELLADEARETLAAGTRPRVMFVAVYQNRRAPREPREEFERLQTLFQEAGLQNLASFVELVREAEEVLGVTQSYNFTMHRPGELPRLPESASLQQLAAQISFMVPSLMVGTFSSGVEGAMVWLRNLSDSFPLLPHEALLVVDGFFQDALELLKNPPPLPEGMF